ncbi:unnamed protein product [Pleuronectes platessa]|uniref:Elongation factor 1-delta n=1 Tax=Pleuronectes platessa TaxID=8262 RepID=A0A9N7UWM7_PLEPL|nr:unnamed protein product [Pleuronectes platessa]
MSAPLPSPSPLNTRVPAPRVLFHRRITGEAARDSTDTEPPNVEQNPDTKMSGLQCLASENIWFDKQRYDEAETHFYEGANGQSSSHAGADQELVTRMKSLELENQTLHKVVEHMKATMLKLESRVALLEKTPATAAVPSAKAAPAKVEDSDDEDDDMDLFGSDEDDEETERLKQERIDAYAAKKAKKPYTHCQVIDPVGRQTLGR